MVDTGAKHFLLDIPHYGVDGTERIPGASYGTTAYGAAAYGATDQLIVTLEPTETAELGKDQISVLELSDLVIAYWARRGLGA